MPDIKPISKDAIPAALEKARHYRILNQPWQAESICRDILRADPDNQQTIYTIILAMTDQFENRFKKGLTKTLEMVPKLTNKYEAEYCAGLIYERQAIAALNRQTPRAGYIAYEYLVKAMDFYEKAEKLRPPANEESVLRWNACLRLINQYQLHPSQEESGTQPLLDV